MALKPSEAVPRSASTPARSSSYEQAGIDLRLVQMVRAARCEANVRRCASECKVRQEVGNGTAGQCERGMRRIGIGEARRTEDVEANDNFDVRHRPEFAGLDAPQSLLRGMVPTGSCWSSTRWSPASWARPTSVFNSSRRSG